MEHITDTRIEQSEPTAVTLGNFDGLHQGHRSLINLTKQFAEEEGLKSVVFTFSPHPMFVFQRKEDFALIVDPSEKKFQMEQMGIDIYIEYPFDMNFAAMDPEDFAVKLIFEKLKCQVLVVGEDYRFGKGAAGNYEMLKRLGAERGIKVIGVPKVLHGDERVSSSRIRRCLLEKNLEESRFRFENPQITEAIYVPKDSFLVTTLMDVYREITQDYDAEPQVDGACSYARALENCVAFGAILPGQPDLMHQKNEYLELDKLDLWMKIYLEAIYRLAQ